jgi:glycosyltransferase involved in cell wall biosynthesis/phospholipid N-methyltransferase
MSDFTSNTAGAVRLAGPMSHRLTPYALSVLIPVYNEENTVAALLESVLSAPLPAGMGLEIVAVDDASRDSSPEILREYAERYPDTIRFYRHEQNQGKGAAIRTAALQARCEFSIIQDADLEYSPSEYPKLLKPLLDNRADAVYGSRFSVGSERRVLYFWHSLANHILTTACNIVADLNLTDMETCYKAFRTSLLQSIPIRSNRFGIEPEITIKLAQRQASIYETPISYHGRTYEEGKKIGWKDAFEAFYLILKYGILHDIYKDPGQEILHAFSYAPKFNRWMADTIRPHLGRRVLEIGAGMGNLTRQLFKGSMHYMATDIDRDHLDRLQNRFLGRPNLQARICDLTNAADFDTLAEQVDTVVCLNVVEHVADDLGALRNIHRALQPGGKAIILVPQGQEIFGTMDEALGHYRRYSQSQLRGVMQQAGFDIESVIEFNRISRPGWYINGCLLKRQKISHLQLRIFDRLVWLWRKIDHWLPWPSTSIIAIGVKSQN